VLPGIHFKYEPLNGLLLRSSYTISIGRPNFGSIFPNTTIDYTNETVNQGNSGLKAQTSDNFDVSIEYYFEPVGLVSASFFLKEISNFIYNAGTTIPQGDNNGFDGLYGGWTLRSAANGGFRVGDRTLSREELLALVDRAPAEFSPSVLLRPIVQDTIFPTACYVAGPSELAYLGQL
jgi:outer membrane receptor protein involved in Fe transport